MELYKKYRPTTLKEVVGQKEARTMLVDMVKRDAVPHVILLHGPNGVGKTTIARILSKKCGCGDADYTEMNAAQDRGIDTIRNLQQLSGLRPMEGPTRWWVVDECHRLTADAQEAALKLWEDTPGHCHYVLCTTDPGKLKKTVRSRATEITLRALTPDVLTKLVSRVAAAEDCDVSAAVAARIAEAADGSGRKALVLLEQIMGQTGDAAQLALVERSDEKQQAIQLCRELFKPKPTWRAVAAVLRDIAAEDPEGIRHLVLAYARTTLLAGRCNPRAASVIMYFGDNYYDTKAAGLALSAYQVVEEAA